MKNNVIIGFFLLVSSVNLNAQETPKAIKKIEKSEIVKNESATYSKTLEVIKNEVNGKEALSYILTINENGEKRVVEWDGQGEIPKEIKQELDSNGHDKSHSRNGESHHKKRVIIEVEEKGDKKVIEWDGEGEMPKDMEQIMKEEDFELNEEWKESKGIRNSSISSDVKVKMGIGINQGEQGVSIDYVEENSPASTAKLKPNDILLKIEDTYILSDDLVFQTLSRFNPGDVIKVTILREGKEVMLNVKLVAK